MKTFITLCTIALAYSIGSAQAQIPTSIPDVCEEVGKKSQGGLYSEELISAINNNGSANDIYRLSFKESLAEVPVIIAKSVRPEARKAAYAISLRRADVFSALGRRPNINQDRDIFFPKPENEIPSFDRLITYLNSLTTNPPQYPENVKVKIKKLLFEHSWIDPSTEKLIKMAGLICNPYKNFTSCKEAFIQTMRYMDARGSGPAYISLPDETIEILSDSTYLRPMALAALKIHNRILNAEKGQPDDGTFLEDMVNSFVESGFSKEESTERAWKLIAVYSTRGASMEKFYFSKLNIEINIPSFIPLFIISAGMNYLDVLPSKNANQLYSLPKKVKFNCKMPKPYHFWNPAYIMRKLIKNGYNPADAALANHLSGKMYAMFREPHKIYTNSMFSAHVNALRIDVVLHSLATAYIKQEDAFLDGDANLNLLFQTAKRVPAKRKNYSSTPLFHNRYWNKLIPADLSFYQYWPN